MADETRVKNVVLLQNIKEKAKLCCDSPKFANNILDIINLAQTEDKSFIGNGELYTSPEVDDESKEGKYKIWLNERYSDVYERLVELLQCKHATVKELSLSTLMKLVTAEGQNPITVITAKQSNFPIHRFQEIMRGLISVDYNHKDLITRFQEYLDYDDVRFHVLKFLIKDIKEKKQQKYSDEYLNNIYAMLEQISFPLIGNEVLSNCLCKTPDDLSVFKVSSLKEQKKLFSSAWVQFLQFKLTSSLYRSVLVILHDKVMPYMTNPLLLSDFLTESYNVGGAISLLALNGLFILVHKFNLDYPEFFTKLYALFEPGVFHAKYRARFFFLADLFLTSSHLPAYLVAAFAKKLSRLCLTAPAPGLSIAVPFIYNLINRHPNCNVLIHRTDSSTDPSKCKALESSLWELKTLQTHYNPDISKMANRIEHPLQTSEIDLSELLENNYHQLFEKETRKKIKIAPVTFIPPKGLLITNDDKIGLCWTMD
ncbi:NOC4 [Mytilus edulis]|uniref:NOC4 n=1 Tax=Mytilus edulis TaxID=6550 RepID=A0A8S3PNQ8_MYTED|nr:NOC4 [Mytilus edulis]